LNFQLCPYAENRIRLIGFADFVGSKYPSDAIRNDLGNKLKNQAKYLFPDLNWTGERQTWIGFRLCIENRNIFNEHNVSQKLFSTPKNRPMSPDNWPYIGKDIFWNNLYLSCGHGSNGWTTSVGSAKLLSNQVSG
jgi:hypothetical protein